MILKGAVKITPGHSQIDFAISSCHNLPVLSVINECGVLNENCGEYFGIKRYDARQILMDKLYEMDLIRGTENKKMEVPVCSRTHDIIEYLIKPQWFIRCNDLSEKVMKAFKNSELIIEPENHHPVWMMWLKSNRDWCISRQLLWGHRLPLYNTPIGWVAATSLENAKCKVADKLGISVDNVKDVVQETDVLDTWFSSALLPFSSFGWPNETSLQKFYPLSIMETGYDILCFWVARMVMLGLYLTGELPFNKVLLHGMVCDGKGRKMSKSIGNVIKPEHVINGISVQQLKEQFISENKMGLLSNEELAESLSNQKNLFPNGIPKCGTDALRFTLLECDVKSQVINFELEACVTNMKFCNKIWQASKFVIGWTNSLGIDKRYDVKPIFPWQVWILSRLAYAVGRFNDDMASFNLHSAVKSFRLFFYHEFCDVILELSKPILNDRSEESVETCNILLHCLEISLRMLSPVMPFISEELYSYLPAFITDSKPVMLTSFPVYSQYSKWRNKKVENEIELIRGLISMIRAVNTKAKVICKDTAEITVVSKREDFFKEHMYMIKTLIRYVTFKFSTIPSKYTFFGPVDEQTRVYLYLPMNQEQCDKYINVINTKIGKLNKQLQRYERITSTDEYILVGLVQTKIDYCEKMKYLRDEINDLETHINSLKIQINNTG